MADIFSRKSSSLENVDAQNFDLADMKSVWLNVLRRFTGTPSFMCYFQIEKWIHSTVGAAIPTAPMLTRPLICKLSQTGRNPIKKRTHVSFFEK